MLHCTTNLSYKIEDNMCCSPDNRPGLLLGLVKVTFYAIPRISDEYKNKILIDIGLSKCLSVPIELRAVIPKLYKLTKCLQSGKLLLEIESVFCKSKLEVKEMFSSSDGLNNDVEDRKQIIEYRKQLKMKQTELYSDCCAILLESTDKIDYYERLCTLLYLEGDHRRRLMQRYIVDASQINHSSHGL